MKERIMNNTYEEDREKLLKYKQEFDKDLQERACKMSWKHDYYFSHYETNHDPQSTCACFNQYAIMICRHCGHYIKQLIH